MYIWSDWHLNIIDLIKGILKWLEQCFLNYNTYWNTRIFIYLVFYNTAYLIIYKVASSIHLTNPFCSKRLSLIQFSNSLSVIFFLFSMRDSIMTYWALVRLANSNDLFVQTITPWILKTLFIFLKLLLVTKVRDRESAYRAPWTHE